MTDSTGLPASGTKEVTYTIAEATDPGRERVRQPEPATRLSARARYPSRSQVAAPRRVVPDLPMPLRSAATFGDGSAPASFSTAFR